MEFILVPYRNRLLESVCRGTLSYLLFNRWEKTVYRFLRSSGIMERIDLIHFASPVGYREPGWLWKLGKPYVWGPLGGMKTIPRCFLKAYPFPDRIKGAMKNAVNRLQFYCSRRVVHAMKQSDVLIACTKEQRTMVNKRLRTNRCRYLPENGLNFAKLSAVGADSFLDKKYGIERVNILWVGTNCVRKMPRLLLGALASCRNSNFHCAFIGAGCSALKQFAASESLQANCSFVDQLPREEVLRLYANAHLLVITSSMEANTTIVWEALENCVPVMTVDHCGMGDVIQDGVNGIKIPVSRYDLMRAEFARQLDRVFEAPAALKALAKNIPKTARQYSQEHRMDFFEQCYQDALQAHKNHREQH